MSDSDDRRWTSAWVTFPAEPLYTLIVDGIEVE